MFQEPMTVPKNPPSLTYLRENLFDDEEEWIDYDLFLDFVETSGLRLPPSLSDTKIRDRFIKAIEKTIASSPGLVEWYLLQEEKYCARPAVLQYLVYHLFRLSTLSEKQALEKPPGRLRPRLVELHTRLHFLLLDANNDLSGAESALWSSDFILRVLSRMGRVRGLLQPHQLDSYDNEKAYRIQHVLPWRESALEKYTKMRAKLERLDYLMQYQYGIILTVDP
jgi:hypothetical protein